MPPLSAPALDLRDIKPLQQVPLGWPWYVSAALAATLVTLTLLALWWWRARRRRAQHAATSAPPEPAFIVAKRALARAYAASRESSASRQTYYFALSEIIRAYVEARFVLNATDLTTEEISRALRERELVSPSERTRLLALLAAADAVKFAQADPSPAACDDAYLQACTFVDATRPAPEVSEGTR